VAAVFFERIEIGFGWGFSIKTQFLAAEGAGRVLAKVRPAVGLDIAHGQPARNANRKQAPEALAQNWQRAARPLRRELIEGRNLGNVAPRRNKNTLRYSAKTSRRHHKNPATRRPGPGNKK